MPAPTSAAFSCLIALSGFVYFSSSAVNGCQSHSINRQSPWQEKAWTNCGRVIPCAMKSMSLWTHCHGKWTILLMRGCSYIATIQLRVAVMIGPDILNFGRSVIGQCLHEKPILSTNLIYPHKGLQISHCPLLLGATLSNIFLEQK